MARSLFTLKVLDSSSRRVAGDLTAACAQPDASSKRDATVLEIGLFAVEGDVQAEFFLVVAHLDRSDLVDEPQGGVAEQEAIGR